MFELWEERESLKNSPEKSPEKLNKGNKNNNRWKSTYFNIVYYDVIYYRFDFIGVVNIINQL